MARLLIVSRSMALAMRLADQHEVNEHPVDDLETLGTELDADVLVLDIGDPMQAVTTVNGLREAGQVTPVLLVSGYQPEWEQVEAQSVEGVVVVPLPITRAALLAGIATLTGAPEPVLDADDADDAQEVAEDADEADEAQEVAADDEPDATTADSGDGADDENDAHDATASQPDQGDPPDDPDEPDDQPEDATGTDVDDASEPAEPAAAEPSESGDAAGPDEPDGAAIGASPRPAGPAWGTTIDPASASSVPVSPPWGETVRVGPAAQAQEASPETGSQGGPPSRRLPRLGNRPRKLQRRPNIADTQGLGLVTDPLGPRTDPYGLAGRTPTGSHPLIPEAPEAPEARATPGPAVSPPTGPQSLLDRRLDAEAAALAQDRPTRGRSASGIVMRPADLVQSLLDQVGDLYGVSDTAQVLADDVIERADADAAAVLVPDGPIWRVSGGVGLRPLERRLILEPTHWLITEIGSAGRAVLIDDTDIIRPQLSGAPLAAWRHLLAVPVPEVRAIVVLARGQEAGPFTDRDLAAVIAPVREAAALLAQAVQTRRLARALSALREAE